MVDSFQNGLQWATLPHLPLVLSDAELSQIPIPSPQQNEQKQHWANSRGSFYTFQGLTFEVRSLASRRRGPCSDHVERRWEEEALWLTQGQAPLCSVQLSSASLQSSQGTRHTSDHTGHSSTWVLAWLQLQPIPPWRTAQLCPVNTHYNKNSKLLFKATKFGVIC